MRRAPKPRTSDAINQCEDERWKCDTCEAPTETDDSRYCLSCRLYWQDVGNGLWDSPIYFEKDCAP